MANQLEMLKQFQTVDGELFLLRRQQEEKPRELEQCGAEVAEQEALVKAADDRLKTLQLSQKEKEIDLQTREASVKKLQGQLFQVKTNKEYAAMQREIDSLKTDNSVLEETILKTFDAIDQAASDRQREQQQLVKRQERLKAEQVRIERELAVIGEQIAKLAQRRQVLVPGIPPETLSLYERILNLRDGLALVPLVSDSCGGCHRRLPPQIVNEVYLSTTLTMCENCNRILYFDDAHSKL